MFPDLIITTMTDIIQKNLRYILVENQIFLRYDTTRDVQKSFGNLYL